MRVELFAISLLLISCAGTWLARRYALWRQLIDQPGERRSHATATPRGGGVAIVVALLVACGWAAITWPSVRGYVAGFSSGLAMVAAIGWWDDHRPLSPLVRLLVHLVASGLLALMVLHVTGSPWLACVSAALAVGLINVWNFMDGINGLATSQALIVAICCALALPPPLALAGLALASACLGFLPFNFPRSWIFLGDAGSGALGYAIAALLALVASSQVAAWWLLPVPICAFLVDAGFTLASRMLSGQRWWEPHTQHLYQRAVRTCGSHAVVTLAYAAFSVLAVVLFFTLQNLQPGRAVAGAMAWLLAAWVIWLLLRRGMRSN